MANNVHVFVFSENNEIQCVKAFTDVQKALKFAIPYVAEKIGYRLTGDDNVDWDVLNTEVDHLDFGWQLKYEVPVE